MKYIVVLIGIIALATYIFTGGPKKVVSRDEPDVTRAQEVGLRIAQLEYQRREMLVRARGRLGDVAAVGGLSRRGAYAAGWREGFAQGYFEGGFLAEGRRPNPLFFAVPGR